MSCLCTLREDRVYDWRRLRHKCSCEGVDEETLAGLLADAATLIRECVRRRVREALEKLGVRVDAKPPRVEGRGARLRLYTGQWVGEVTVARASGGRVAGLTLRLRPKYARFERMLGYVKERLRDVLHWLQPLTPYILAPLDAGPPPIEAVLTLLDEHVASGRLYTRRAGRVALNTRLVATVTATLSLAARAARSYLESLPGEARLLEEARLSRLIAAYTSDPRISHILAKAETLQELDPDEQVLAQASALLRKRRPTTAQDLLIGSPTPLTPSTTIYELLVLAKTLEALGGVEKAYSPTHIETPAATVYYNRPPPSHSRIVYRLSGRTPHPDILVELERGTRIVIDAKYRLTPRLRLPDALRIAAYLADLARDTTLKAIITVPRLPDSLEEHQTTLDSMSVKISLLEVNEETSPERLRRALME